MPSSPGPPSIEDRLARFSKRLDAIERRTQAVQKLRLSQLGDVRVTTPPDDHEFLTYDQASGLWMPGTVTPTDPANVPRLEATQTNGAGPHAADLSVNVEWGLSEQVGTDITIDGGDARLIDINTDGVYAVSFTAIVLSIATGLSAGTKAFGSINFFTGIAHGYEHSFFTETYGIQTQLSAGATHAASYFFFAGTQMGGSCQLDGNDFKFEARINVLRLI